MAIAREASHGDSIAGADLSNTAADTNNPVDPNSDPGSTESVIAGGALGGLAGLIAGLGSLTIPGVGPVVAGGALATALGTTIGGSAVGAPAGGIRGAFLDAGLPEDRANVYSGRLSQGAYV